uniref:Uncharacterized protein n=1 Tax=Rhizophora mucronata TaxID=61149 RepID=A0A2P2PVV8_RHIMU
MPTAHIFSINQWRKIGTHLAQAGIVFQ